MTTKASVGGVAESAPDVGRKQIAVHFGPWPSWLETAPAPPG